MPNGIALDYLEPIEKAQLLHFRPDLEQDPELENQSASDEVEIPCQQ